MDIKAYLDSGILEDYCLHLLSAQEAATVEDNVAKYPEIRAALLQLQDGIAGFVAQYERTPSTGVDGLMAALSTDRKLEALSLTSDQRLASFVPIHSGSDHLKWERLVKDLSPPEDFALHAHPLYQGEEGSLMVVWIDKSLPPESHADLYESFLLLEGYCSGKLGDQELEIRPGSFLNIPLDTEHSLEVLSDRPAKLILMRKRVA